MRNDSLAIHMDLVNSQPLNSLIMAIEFQGKQSIRVTKNLKIRKFDEATYARWMGPDFQNGTIEVQGEKALLYGNQGKQPEWGIDDLKPGAEPSGRIGLWMEIGTEGYFANLTVKND